MLGLVLQQRPEAKQRTVPFLAVVDPKSGRACVRNLDDLEPQGAQTWNTSRIAEIIAAGDVEVRGGPAASGEPGWLMRKWQRFWR